MLKYLFGIKKISLKKLTNIFSFVYITNCLIATSVLVGCDSFVNVDLPKDQLVKESVFENKATATAALRNIYGNLRSITNFDRLLGMYADELDAPNDRTSFFDHSIIQSNQSIANLWSSYYSIIFSTNSLIEGVEGSSALELEDKTQLTGEALFIRAYVHTKLVELFGPIPYINTTNYKTNSEVSRISEDDVYSYVIQDLNNALGSLGEDVSKFPEKRIRVYNTTVKALLARVYLYTFKWEQAERMASEVIDEVMLEQNLDEVFLKDSSGTIWQFVPDVAGENTSVAETFIFINNPSFTQPTLSTLLVEGTFESNDLRKSNWVGQGTGGAYYAFKYKEVTNTQPESLEYLVEFRLAEQYLIRAEARAELDKISESQADLNVIRNRAGLANTTASTPNQLREAILRERFVELFTEGGHRWFDLKRMRKAEEVLAPIKPGWRKTDILLPIPESEILLNPNLLPQNEGYN
ncbi:RagB/SusD family nutrient uptake outer membrane protein [Flavivirga sp. Y03]|uniref:RagB/SusD family nutrient uptake outer membrane protein n=2 Tax=Flavivirga algicola TaxID=2729136 RepID=A0ABX1S1E8_9FLAO|nr:RagB/SusD family nutrient uptake outer membrane protein [Flavivirga algicola]